MDSPRERRAEPSGMRSRGTQQLKSKTLCLDIHNNDAASRSDYNRFLQTVTKEGLQLQMWVTEQQIIGQELAKLIQNCQRISDEQYSYLLSIIVILLVFGGYSAYAALSGRTK